MEPRVVWHGPIEHVEHVQEMSSFWIDLQDSATQTLCAVLAPRIEYTYQVGDIITVELYERPPGHSLDQTTRISINGGPFVTLPSPNRTDK